MIVWQKEFETGSELLDRQHQMLIENINLLEELLRNPSPSKGDLVYLANLVDYLESYANVHFKNEEDCMESHNCPAHRHNMQEHENFRHFIRDYKRLCELEGFKLNLLDNLHAEMSNWIKDHILKIDTRLKPCIRQN
jgi:hemerythrin